MKYIKTYENNNIKDYIICDDIRADEGVISIYKVIKKHKNDLALKIISRYNNGIKHAHIHNMIYYGEKYNNLNIYYETDHLDDALERINLISMTNKYNL